jgi:quinol monooxygenase YgiN
MEVFIFARLRARPGVRSELQQAMFEVQGPTRAEPGCLSYGAFQSLRAFDRHALLPHTVRFIAALEPLLDHPFAATLAQQLW